ncbi:MAG: CpaF/VirB11 family protein [Bacilli bacterium]|nr:CpaF/VirB11 family protein [Bacilli bacterium]
MDKDKAIEFIESSFLSTLLTNPNVTDISYNGDSIYYMDNLKGRCLSNIKIDFEAAKDFIRQIANICEKQFSYQQPKLDASFGRYRINAVHQSIAKRANQDVINFAIRVGSTKLRVTENSGFLTPQLVALFDRLLSQNCSIIIGGETGTGKTEFQKYLISRMHSNTRVIVIDNVLELDYAEINPGIDLNIWQANNDNSQTSIHSLIKNALRSNPDWLIIAESLGEEMVDVLNSALTGHPIITTIHAKDIKSMPRRMAKMVCMGDKKIEYADALDDIGYNFRFYVYLKRKILDSGEVKRYIDEISYLKDNEWNLIYKESTYFDLNEEVQNYLGFEPLNKERVGANV